VERATMMITVRDIDAGANEPSSILSTAMRCGSTGHDGHADNPPRRRRLRCLMG